MRTRRHWPSLYIALALIQSLIVPSSCMAWEVSPQGEAIQGSVAVSLLTPTLGGDTKHILIAIECAKSQTVAGGLELIVVDGGVDASLSAAELPAFVKYVRVLPSPPSSTSISELYEIGIHNARGQYIVHWDPALWHSSDRLHVQLQPLLNASADVTVVEPVTLLVPNRRPASTVRFVGVRGGCASGDPLLSPGRTLAYTAAAAARYHQTCGFPDSLVDPVQYFLACLYHSGATIASVTQPVTALLVSSVSCLPDSVQDVPPPEGYSLTLSPLYASLAHALPEWPLPSVYASLPAPLLPTLPQASLQPDPTGLVTVRYWGPSPSSSLLPRLSAVSGARSQSFRRALTSDTGSGAGLACNSTQYVMVSPSGSSSCANCTQCEPGEAMVTPCTSTADAVCVVVGTRYLNQMGSSLISGLATAQSDYDASLASLAWFYKQTPSISAFNVPRLVLSLATVNVTAAVGLVVPNDTELSEFFAQLPTALLNYTAVTLPPGNVKELDAIDWRAVGTAVVSELQVLTAAEVDSVSTIIASIIKAATIQLQQLFPAGNFGSNSPLITNLKVYVNGLTPTVDSLRQATIRVPDVLLLQSDLASVKPSQLVNFQVVLTPSMFYINSSSITNPALRSALQARQYTLL